MGQFITRYVDWGAKLAGVFVCASVLGGCGGVELEGKVFDYMGVSGSTAKKPDVHMTERPPLLIPPSTRALPQPGSGSTATARADWPDDPEKVRVRVAEQKEEAEAKNTPVDNRNPYSGKQGILDKLLSRDKTVEEPLPDVPEPDASDRLPAPSTTAVVQQPTAITPHQTQEPLPSRPAQSTAPDSYGGMSNPQGNNANW